jgi:hypothetical protein
MAHAKFTLRAPFSKNPRLADAEGALLAPTVRTMQADGRSVKNASILE